MGRKQKKYRKALEALVYVTSLERRNYWALKVFYFADKEHLRRYGRQLFGDSYRAMKQGPVPSLAYDIVKFVRGDGYNNFDNPDPSTAIRVPDNRTIIPLRDANKKLLSESEIVCLDYAHELVKDLTFGELKRMSHDPAYDSVGQDEEMTLESIVQTLNNSDEVMDYINC